MSTLQEYKSRKQDLMTEIQELKYHLEAINGLIEIHRSSVESRIISPATGQKDLINAKLLRKEQLESRHALYHYKRERADVVVAIDAKEQMLKVYDEHVRQQIIKQSATLTDEMIFDKLTKAQSLQNMTPEEQATLKGIEEELPKRMTAGKDSRIEVYEALQNLIIQHG